MKPSYDTPLRIPRFYKRTVEKKCTTRYDLHFYCWFLIASYLFKLCSSHLRRQDQLTASLSKVAQSLYYIHSIVVVASFKIDCHDGREATALFSRRNEDARRQIGITNQGKVCFYYSCYQRTVTHYSARHVTQNGIATTHKKNPITYT